MAVLLFCWWRADRLVEQPKHPKETAGKGASDQFSEAQPIPKGGKVVATLAGW
jgi:hypothetical protein